MKKRACVLFLILVSLFTLTGVRIVSVSSAPRRAGSPYSSMSIDIGTLKGTVYDCNLQPLTNSEAVFYAAAKPSATALAQLKGKLVPDVFNSVYERMMQGKPIAVKVNSAFSSCEDIICIKLPERYSSDSLACHIIGYSDSQGNGVSGIEKAYDSVLSRYKSTVKVRFSQNADGKILLGDGISVSGSNTPENGVVLTLDKNIQKITENALDKSGAECGAAVVIDVENGAIRACVSRPVFRQSNIAAYLDDENSPLINRALLPFSVGSVFKPVVAAAALENGIGRDFEYNCTGSAVCNGVTFNCHEKDGHGIIDMGEAVAVSCNTYFIALALETGAESILNTASGFGLGKGVDLADGLSASSGNLTSLSELDSDAAIANLSFGQGSLLATPLQICSAMSTLGRGGVYIEPYLIEGETQADGSYTRIKNYSEKKQIVSSRTAELVKSFLEKVVAYGSGSRAQTESVKTAGKTATAQTGKTQNGEEIYNAWFAGYFPAENPRYAVAILIENGGEGAVSCAPIFKEIAENICNYSKKEF